MKIEEKMGRQLPQTWIDHDKRIKPYLWSHRILSLGGSCLTLGLLIWFVVTLRAFYLEMFLESKISNTFLVWLAYFGIIGIVMEVCTMPLSLGHHWVERSHGLSKQTYLSWFWDKVKGWLVGGVLGTLFM